MDATLTSYISQPSIIVQLLAGTAAIAAVAFGGAMAVPKFTRKLIPNPKATRLGDHIKFTRMHKNRRTIIGEDGVHTVVLNVRGTDLRFNDTGKQQTLSNARQSWVEQMSDLGIRTRVYLMRDRLPRAANYKNGHGVMAEVSDTWNKNLPLALSTEYYIALSVKDATKGVMRLDEAIEQTKSVLSDYHVTELTDEYEVAERVEDGVHIDEMREDKLTPAAFFGRMLAPLSRPNPIGERRDRQLSYELTTDNVRYDPDLGMIEFTDGPSRKYAAVFVIEEWSTPMFENHMLELMAYPFEMTICHDIDPIGKGKALASLRWQEKMAPGLSPGSDAADQYSTVAAAIERGSEEEQDLCNVQTMITIYGDTPEEVHKGRSVINQLKQIGITPIWPKYTMMQHWFGHFPGFDAQSRPQRILSGEVALLCTFQYTPSGQNSSDWGDGPIAMFETLDGAPYAFQFHAPGGGSPPLGHCVCVGPSGQGKTTLVTFLASMALRHENLKTFFFDRGRGCEVITKALKGSNLYFGCEEDENPTALNPFQKDNTDANRQFLR
jgi:type IV secretion system protein VirB4